MDRILSSTGITDTSVKDSWKKVWSPAILKQASNEKASNSRLRWVMDTLVDEHGTLFKYVCKYVSQMGKFCASVYKACICTYSL